MRFIQKKHDGNITRLTLFGKTIVRKEKFLSSHHYFVWKIRVAKKILRPDYTKTYILGVKVREQKIDVVSKILPYAGGKDFIYFCMHTGDFYYLCKVIKVCFEEFKDTVIITNFGYNRQVFNLFGFPEDWLSEHLVIVPKLWLFSLGLWCRADGTVLSKVELSHEKGWIVNGKIQKKAGRYFPVSECIAHFLHKEHSPVCSPARLQEAQKNGAVLLIPESQFNGNLSVDFCKEIISCVREKGLSVLINTNGTAYDMLLSEGVTKVFLPYKETFDLAAQCNAVVSVRCGLTDNLQSLFFCTKFFIFYQFVFYPQYKYFRHWQDWFDAVYSFNKINATKCFHEFRQDEEKLISSIKKELEGDK